MSNRSSKSPLHIPIDDIEILHKYSGEQSQSGVSGAAGKVVRGLWNRKIVAVKLMHVLNEDVLGEGARMINEDKKKEIEKEAENYSKLDHPRIIKFYGLTRVGNCVHIVVEYVEGGSLHELIDRCAKKIELLDELSKIQIALDVAVGVNYLHAERKMIHRDLKPLNILICEYPYRAKLCDFGSARDVGNITSHNVGTALYAAPEVLTAGDVKKRGSFKGDVYSFGVTFWCLYFERRPPGLRFPPKMPKVAGTSRHIAKTVNGIVKDCCREVATRRCSMKWVVEKLTGLLEELKAKTFTENEMRRMQKEQMKLRSDVSKREAEMRQRIADMQKEMEAQRKLLKEKEGVFRKVVGELREEVGAKTEEVEFVRKQLRETKDLKSEDSDMKREMEKQREREEILLFERSLVGKCAMDFELVKVLGQGGMSVIFEVKMNARTFAMKFVFRLRYHEEQIQWILPPDAILRLPIHPNLVRLHHWFIGRPLERRILEKHGVELFYEGLSSKKAAYFILQKCDGITLEALIQQRRRPTFDDDEFFDFLSQIISGLLVMKKHHVIHCDIKPNNLFYIKKRFMIGDFGCCFDSRNTDDPESFTYRYDPRRGVINTGAALYTPPEIRLMHGRELKPGYPVRFDKNDVYSLGVVCFKLFTEREFGHSRKPVLTKEDCRYVHIRDLVRRMVADYNERPCLEELKERVDSFREE